MAPTEWGDMGKQVVSEHDPLTAEALNRICEVDRVPGDYRRHQDHQATCSVHLFLKGPVPHDPPPAKEEGSPQRVRPFMPVQAHFDPSSVGLITEPLDQMQRLLHLADLP